MEVPEAFAAGVGVAFVAEGYAESKRIVPHV
jgi:hypothetical protein